ncbi:zinc finger BED domain-containing protein RICESLEEPER 2-like protein [Tanacetum coccineum]
MSLGPVHDKEKIIKKEKHDYDIPLHDGVMQPSAPQTVHITPPDDDYVAPATNPILDKQLNEFRKEFFDITRVAKKENCNPINDVKELSDIKTYDCRGSSEPGLAPAIVNGKYDHIRMRESIAHYILMHEHSFSIVEEAGFNFMIKVGIPQWPGLSRTTEKNKCVKVYENQKKKLKDMLKKVDSITLMTDMWKSKCQKIGYMEWDIENKIYSISMDNVSANDKAIENLRRIFEVDRKLLYCKTLWNSTYEMRVGAYKFREVFPKYDERDSDFDSCLLNDDWVKVEEISDAIKQRPYRNGGRVFKKSYTQRSGFQELHNFVRKNEASPTQKSDLDVYFEDGCYMCAPENNKNFNILDWWKNHELKYRILSKLAHDILAISITTVASEATFSA